MTFQVLASPIIKDRIMHKRKLKYIIPSFNPNILIESWKACPYKFATTC